jgi:hypothetical protein
MRIGIVGAGPAGLLFALLAKRRRPDDEIVIVEQNFDYDLLSPAALMQKAVGQTVTLLRTNPATGEQLGTVPMCGTAETVRAMFSAPTTMPTSPAPPRLTASALPNCANAGPRPIFCASFENARSAVSRLSR